MKDYGYRFSCHESNINYLTHWGFEIRENAEMKLGDIACSCCKLRGSFTIGTIYEREFVGGEIRVNDLKEYKYFLSEDGLVVDEIEND